MRHVSQTLTNIKLNLGLAVTGRRSDGMHNISSLMVQCDAGELLTYEPEGDLDLQIEGSSPCPPDQNLVLQASRRVGVRQGKFFLQKQFPPGSGLGSGSSNAAGALRLLQRHYGFSEKTLLQSACELGSDVPFFLYSSPCLATNTGTKLQAVAIPPPLFALILRGKEASNTAQAYGQLARHQLYDPPLDLDAIQLALQRKQLQELMELMPNSFEKIFLRNKATWLLTALQDLRTHGFLFRRLSGSGTAVFGLSTDRQHVFQAHQQLASDYFFCRAVQLLTGA